METLFNVPTPVCNPFGYVVRRDTVLRMTRVAAIPIGIGATLNHILRSVSFLFRGDKMLPILCNVNGAVFARLLLEKIKS